MSTSYRKEYYQKNRDKIREYNQRWRDNRVRKGLCISCENPLSANSKCYCEFHRLMNTQQHSRPASSSGKKAYNFYITEIEYEALKQRLEELRASQ